MCSIKTSDNYALRFLLNNFMVFRQKYGKIILQKYQRGAFEKFNGVHTE